MNRSGREGGGLGHADLDGRKKEHPSGASFREDDQLEAPGAHRFNIW